MLGKLLNTIILVALSMLLLNCGEVGDADIGNSIIVTASIEKNYVEQDIITTLDGSCNYTFDNSTIPPVNTNQITINVKPLSTDIPNPSPVSIIGIEVSYIPFDRNTPNINKFFIGDSKYIEPNTSLTFPIPVVNSNVLQNFATAFLGGTNVNYTYYVNVNIKLKEIYTNKDLEKQVRFTLTLKNIIGDNECTNTNVNNL